MTARISRFWMALWRSDNGLLGGDVRRESTQDAILHQRVHLRRYGSLATLRDFRKKLFTTVSVAEC